MDCVKICKDFDRVKSSRANFDQMYQTLGEYIAMNRQNFTGTPSNGQFLTDRIFDATGAFAAQNSANILVGMLWPGVSANAFELIPPNESVKEDSFYEDLNKKVHAAFDDPAANFAESLDEYMIGQIVFGTSGIGCELGDESDLFFSPYGVKEIYPISGKGGRVAGFYLFFEWTVERVAAEYGLENCSEQVKQAYESGKLDDKVQVLFAVKQRTEKKAAAGKFAMPFVGYHIDYKSKHTIKEDGYNELPIVIGRFSKLTYEDMGRSLAMNALPDIREANALREALIIATEKVLEMPKGVLSDGDFGGGSIDQSAGAINVFNSSGLLGTTAPVFEIGSPPNIPWAEKRLEKLEQTIAQHFMLDRLLNFNNDVHMTLGEAQIREQRIIASLAALFSRQNQILQQVIARGVGLLMRAGKVGVQAGSPEEAAALARGETPEYIPDSIVKLAAEGKDVYKINYKTKAALAHSSEQYIAILEVFNLAATQAQIAPDMVQRIDYQKGLEYIAKMRGIQYLLRSKEEMAAREQAQQQQQQVAQALQAGEQVANIADKAASAEQRSRA